MKNEYLSKAFLIILLVAVMYAVYKVFEPFLTVILAAAILVTIFYTPYEQLLKFVRGRKAIASFIMCFLIVLLVIWPVVNFITYTAQRSIDAYAVTVDFFESKDVEGIVKSGIFNKFNVLGLDSETIKKAAIEIAKKANDWLVSGAAIFIKGTTNFLISFVLIIFTMFFFFADGKEMVEKIMRWTPLSNKYDRAIFKKFQDVSSSTMLSTFITAIAQGLLGAIGFIVVGLPAFFPALAMGFLSLVPYVGTALIWLPASIYLFFMGQVWQGVFLLVWGAGIISTVDNLIKAYIIKGKAQVHPIFIVFSILGGIALFGFWGLIFGPLIISLAVTILHIYEMEYESVLEK
ncbi:AI-2E family transporter [bacterium]|nr:AI-2E family transporter [bacterium]